MRTINRAALIVKPRAPYLDWAASLEDGSPVTAQEALADHVAVYLVPEDPDEQEETAPLDGFYQHVFERELEGWVVDEALWPKNRTLEMFLDWFEVRGESVVVDLGTGKIKTEDW